MKARQHLLAQVVVVTQRTPAPAYNVMAVSHGRTGLQRRGRLSWPHRLTTSWPFLATAPVYNVAVDSPVHTGLNVSTRDRLGRD